MKALGTEIGIIILLLIVLASIAIILAYYGAFEGTLSSYFPVLVLMVVDVYLSLGKLCTCTIMMSLIVIVE